jgi:hypothetical protein
MSDSSGVLEPVKDRDDHGDNYGRPPRRSQEELDRKRKDGANDEEREHPQGTTLIGSRQYLLLTFCQRLVGWSGQSVSPDFN